MSSLNIGKKEAAVESARKAQVSIEECLNRRQSFLVEAGAGAGKTHSLVEALLYILVNHSADLASRNRKVACITYTNIAKEEIEARTDRHPAIHAATIHSFLWSVISRYQSLIRSILLDRPGWPARLETAGLSSGQWTTYKVCYSTGHSRVIPGELHISHQALLEIAKTLLGKTKFRRILAYRYPYVFIDEYQDTDSGLVDILKTELLGKAGSPLLGFFGDSWQNIYPTGCGSISSSHLVRIDKGANFRSAPQVVGVLNNMRPLLIQSAHLSEIQGSARAYHTNSWNAVRRTKSPWKDDLSEEDTSKCLEILRRDLEKVGWDFLPGNTKILMLTHKILAGRQGYARLAESFKRSEEFAQKENSFIAFLLDQVEPVCRTFEERGAGAALHIASPRTAELSIRLSKGMWLREFLELARLRNSGTIGQVIEWLGECKAIGISLLTSTERFKVLLSENEAVVDKIKNIPYKEIVQLSSFVDYDSGYSTKHGVKGAEFDNVLVVAGGGWANYDFNRMLECRQIQGLSSSDKAAFVRARNLFYVACSRAKLSLAVLFTQQLSSSALGTLNDWFGSSNVVDAPRL